MRIKDDSFDENNYKKQRLEENYKNMHGNPQFEMICCKFNKL